MNTSDPEMFRQLAADHNVIPLIRERLGDVETPISLAAKLEAQGRFFLLESVEGGETWGRYSILGFGIRREFVIDQGRACLTDGDHVRQLDGNPIDALQTYLRGFRVADVPGLPRFAGGAVGYLSFEAVRFFERCGEVKDPACRFEDARFVMADNIAVFDNLNHCVKLVHCAHVSASDDPDACLRAGLAELDRAEALLFDGGTPAAPQPRDDQAATVRMQSNMSREAFENMVATAKDYIRDGDIIQVVLAQHFTSRVKAPHLDVYRALRFINPSPYMYYLKLDDERSIVGSSPEVMVRVGDNVAEIRPIAGTRPRGATVDEDRALAAELLADPKERAEHVMLVDLARNDLGRVARTGTVDVRDYMIIERYSHVMHIVSHVEAQVREDLDAIDVFRASFPAGTLSGAPKVRAMEIINELEPHGRGPYGGALGYIGYGGKVMDLAITIRTVVLDGAEATVTAGAGIVCDSVPAREYEETLHKSHGMRRALQMAAAGLHLGESG